MGQADSTPLSPESIGRTICDAFDQHVRQRAERPGETFEKLVQALYEQLVAPDPVAGARGALWVLTHKSEYVYQNLAGELLTFDELPCPESLETLLDDILPRFNASSNKSVRFLVSSCGAEALLEEVRRRLALPKPPNRLALETFLYWLGEQ